MVDLALLGSSWIQDVALIIGYGSRRFHSNISVKHGIDIPVLNHGNLSKLKVV